MKTKLALRGAGLLLSAFAVVTAVRAQAGCDEGVIRLPDRNGTVQICSALAAQVPQLARQLGEATRALGDQRTQIRELTRLVRGLNGVSHSIGADRQAAMLRTLSAELAKAQGGGDAQLSRQVENLSEQLESLREQMLGALATQGAAPTAASAIQGAVGDAIARLDFAGASRQLQEISARLKALQSQVGEVQSDTKAIRKKLDSIDERDQTDRLQQQDALRKGAEEMRRFQESPERLLNANVFVAQDWEPGMAKPIPTLKYDLNTLNPALEWKNAKLVLGFAERGKAGIHVDASPLLDLRRVGTGQKLRVRNPAAATDLALCLTVFDPERQRRVTWWQEFSINSAQAAFEIAVALRPAQIAIEKGEQKCIRPGSKREPLEIIVFPQRQAS